MSDTGTQPETNQPNTETLAAQPTPAPQANDASAASGTDSKTEELARELEKLKMRNNQLENEKAEADKKKAEQEAKELEEQGKWKDIAEQEKAKREALEAAQAENEKKQNLESLKSKTLEGFSEDVKARAEKLGFDLTDDSEEAVNSFKAKLEEINSWSPSANSTVQPNNPTQPTSDNNRSELLQEHVKSRGGSQKFIQEAIGSVSAFDVMKKQAGWEDQ